MGAALRIILILVIAWYVIRVVDRVIAPFFASAEKKKAPRSKKENEFRKSTSHGDVTITNFSKRSKDVRPGDEDFVDYEEVD